MEGLITCLKPETRQQLVKCINVAAAGIKNETVQWKETLFTHKCYTDTNEV
jgi:hypothetical protein